VLVFSLESKASSTIPLHHNKQYDGTIGGVTGGTTYTPHGRNSVITNKPYDGTIGGLTGGTTYIPHTRSHVVTNKQYDGTIGGITGGTTYIGSHGNKTKTSHGKNRAVGIRTKVNIIKAVSGKVNVSVASTGSLSNYSAGSLFFSPDLSMMYKVVTKVEAIIFRKNKLDVTFSDLSSITNQDTKLVGKDVPHVGEDMVAELIGPKDIFKIEPEGLSPVYIDKGKSNQWVWYVTPLKHKDSFLTVKVYLVDKNKNNKMIKQAQENIHVSVSSYSFIDLFDDSISYYEKHATTFNLILGSSGLIGVLKVLALFFRKKGIH